MTVRGACLPHSCKVRFLALSVTFVCLFVCASNISGNRWMDLRQIHRKHVFGPSIGRVWMSRSKVKVTRDKNGIFRPFWRPVNYPGNRSTDLCHICSEACLIPHSDEFKCQGHGSRSPEGGFSSPLTVHCKASHTSYAANDVIQQQTSPFHRSWGWREGSLTAACVHVWWNIFNSSFVCFSQDLTPRQRRLWKQPLSL